METHRSEFRVAKMAEVLKVSRSGFYAYLARPVSNRQQENEILLEKIKEIHQKSKATYGYPRIADDLKDQATVSPAPSKNRVYRLMREAGIRAKTVKKYKATTNSNHDLPVAENLLNREFSADKPNQKWVSDITQKLLKKNGFKCSMSRRGNCWDNAPMESFWGKLKQEWLYGNRFRTRDEAKAAIFEYVEIFYNRQRKHSSNNYKVPMDFMKAA